MKTQLSKNDVWQLNELIKRGFQMADLIQQSDRVELIDNEVYTVNNRPWYVKLNNRLFPAINRLLEHNFLKKVTVDMGAVQFVTTGADVFRPGIKVIDETIEKDEVVVVVDERHGKPLAVGVALLSGKEIKALDKGKVVKIVHYVGDRVWDLAKTI